MNIYLIRHGETNWNKENLMQGQVDIPLNQKGIQQAQELSQHLNIPFTKVYVSPLQRALKTAQILLPKEIFIIDERLKEFSYGPYEGKRLDEVDDNFKNFLFHPRTVLPPKEVETIEHLNKRIQSFIDDLKEDNVLIVTHGIAMRSFIELLTPLNPWATDIKNCTLYKIDTHAHTFTQMS